MSNYKKPSSTMVIEIDRKTFEKVVAKVLNMRDARQLAKEFSMDMVFFLSIVRDMSLGVESDTHKAIQSVCNIYGIKRQFATDQANFVLSQLLPELPEEDHYKRLGVNREDSAEEIRKKWISKVEETHPDKVGESGLEKTKELNEAYEILADHEKRLEYDLKLYNFLPVKIKSSFFSGSKLQVAAYAAAVVLIISLTIPAIYRYGSQLPKENADISKTLPDVEAFKHDDMIVVKDDNINNKITVDSDSDVNTVEASGRPEEKAHDDVSADLIIAKERIPDKALTSDSPSEIDTPFVVDKRSNTEDMLNDAESDANQGKGFGLSVKEDRNDSVQLSHTVKSGDSLWEIANRYDVPMIHIAKENSIVGEGIKVGDVLKIPAATSPSTIPSANPSLEEKKRVATRPDKKPDISDAYTVQPSSYRVDDIDRTAKADSETEWKPDRSTIFLFVSSYVSAYKHRDWDLYRSYFAIDAMENGEHISKTLPIYRDNFVSIDIMGYDVKINDMHIKKSTASIDGSFRITYKNRKGHNIKRSDGKIQWLLNWIDNGWKIKELNYEVNRNSDLNPH